MPYELFIALRYLRAKRRQAAASVITAISVAGITLGVAALIVAQALITGFRSDVQNKILQGTAHLNLLREDNGGVENYAELVRQALRIPGVRSASATIYAPALLGAGDRQEQAILKAIDMTSTEEVDDLKAILTAGDLAGLTAAPESETESDSQPAGGIIVGAALARTMGLKVGDEVVAISGAPRLTPVGLQQRPRYTNFRVAGLFSSGLNEYDSKWAYVTLPSAQRLTGGMDQASIIQIKLWDIYAVGEIGARVRAIAGPGFMTTNWQELNRPLFAALQLQQRMVVIFFSLLIAVAALNIITTLTMTVIEKHRDIAILRAQGSTPASIRRIFLLQGLVIGLTGAGAGLILGLILSALANRYQLVSIPAEIYSVAYITLKVRAFDCLLIVLTAVMICLLATLYPSRSAARLSPTDALRYE
jgi:lipoprotein-releasing system permease protein